MPKTMPKLNGGQVTWAPDNMYMQLFNPSATSNPQTGQREGGAPLGIGPFKPVAIHDVAQRPDLAILFKGCKQVVELPMPEGGTRLMHGDMFVAA